MCDANEADGSNEAGLIISKAIKIKRPDYIGTLIAFIRKGKD